MQTVLVCPAVFSAEYNPVVHGYHRQLFITSERFVVMKKSDTVYILSCCFAAMTAFFYCCTRWFPINLPRYYPLEHTWKWLHEKGVPSQRWYSMQAFAFLAAAIATFIVYVIIRKFYSQQTDLKPVYVKSLGVITTIVIVICMSYIVYHEFSKWGIL